MFNEICINEEMLPKYTYIYIYTNKFMYIFIYIYSLWKKKEIEEILFACTWVQIHLCLYVNKYVCVYINVYMITSTLYIQICDSL